MAAVGRTTVGPSVGIGAVGVRAGKGEGPGRYSELSAVGEIGFGSRAALSAPLAPATSEAGTEGWEGRRVRGTIRYTFAGAMVGGAGIIAGAGEGMGKDAAWGERRGSSSNAVRGGWEPSSPAVPVSPDQLLQAIRKQATKSTDKNTRTLHRDGRPTIPPLARVEQEGCVTVPEL